MICSLCWLSRRCSRLGLYLRYEVYDYSKFVARQLTAHDSITWMWSRCVCGPNKRRPAAGDFVYIHGTKPDICVRVNRTGPFRIVSKGPKRADHAAGTDFTRPRHGSCQLSLIEILKCHASLAAAATETIPGEFRRRQTENKDQPESLLIIGILSRTIINVILCASYNSFFLARYLRLRDHKLALSFSTFALCEAGNVHNY